MRSLTLTVIAVLTLPAVAAVACGSSDEDAGAGPAAAAPVPSASRQVAIATPTPDAGQVATQSIIAAPRAVPQIADFDTSITGAEALAQAGQTVKVCGTVVEIVKDPVSQHVFSFNFDAPSPDHTFAALVGDQPQRRHGVWPGSPETFYVGKGLCVVGRIELRADVPYIVINHSDQVELIE